MELQDGVKIKIELCGKKNAIMANFKLGRNAMRKTLFSQ